ncbi:PKD domain-containing protein [Labilibacter sediminis]|nr:PKD domain-containing protein [Labilibacter sediminis]
MIMKMKKTNSTKFLSIILTVLLLGNISCKKDDEVANPSAGFEYDSESEVPFGVPLKVAFYNNSSNTIDATTYLWDFGDGIGTSTEKEPIYTYEKGGSYTVSLTVSNSTSKTSIYTEVIELTNQLVGVWKMDMEAASTIDTFDVLGAMEFGEIAGWDGQKWTIAGEGGFSTFWSNVIFKGDYFGRTMLFDNEFTFTADGVFERKLIGDQFLFYAGEQTLPESVDWIAGDGTSLNGYKSKDNMSWALSENQDNNETSVLTLRGDANAVPWLGMYFAGNVNMVSEECEYVVSLVNNNQLIVSGVSNLFAPDNLFVIKFKRVQ